MFSVQKQGDQKSDWINLAVFLLLTGSEDKVGTCQICIDDKDSQNCYTDVQVEGVPAQGIVDSGYDLAVFEGDLLRKVAAIARLHHSQFKKPDKTPRSILLRQEDGAQQNL